MTFLLLCFTKDVVPKLGDTKKKFQVKVTAYDLPYNFCPKHFYDKSTPYGIIYEKIPN